MYIPEALEAGGGVVVVGTAGGGALGFGGRLVVGGGFLVIGGWRGGLFGNKEEGGCTGRGRRPELAWGGV